METTMEIDAFHKGLDAAGWKVVFFMDTYDFPTPENEFDGKEFRMTSSQLALLRLTLLSIYKDFVCGLLNSTSGHLLLSTIFVSYYLSMKKFETPFGMAGISS
jgi:hypothetical protein